MANWYVNKAASSGLNNGLNWTNAWKEMDQINWSSISAGDTIWLAGGTYSAKMSVGASGTVNNRIKIYRVLSTDIEQTNVAGWDSSYDSTVIINISVNYAIWWNDGPDIGSYVTIDGRIDGGIKCVIGDLDNGAGVKLRTGSIGVILKNIEVSGPADSNGYAFLGDVRGLDLVNNGAGLVRDFQISGCRIHGVVDAIYLLGVSGGIIENNKIYDIRALQPPSGIPIQHDNVCISYSTSGMIFRYNEIYNWQTEGIGLFGSTPHTNWKIHNNLWHDIVPSAVGVVVESQEVAHGPIYFYNNTCVNTWVPIRTANGGSWNTGCESKNNIFWNFTGYNTNFPNSNYNFSDGALNEINGISTGNNPFVNYNARNYNIVSNIGSKYPRDKGTNLNSEYSLDFTGNIHGSDGLWDIGALEFVATSNVPILINFYNIREILNCQEIKF